MHPLVNVAIKAARAAGREILKNFDNPELMQVHSKGVKDLVTDVDVRVEQLIVKIIHSSYPKHAILGEESGMQGEDDRYLWIIDPIDGTANFAHGLPSFCVSIAVACRGRVEHGVIYDPIRQELFNASYGEGAFLNNRRIRCSGNVALSRAMLSVVNGTVTDHKPSAEQFLQYYQSFYTAAPRVRQQGTVALDCAYLAAGRLDGLAAFNMSYWDLAAGALLIQEAGGTVMDPYGQDSKGGNNRDSGYSHSDGDGSFGIIHHNQGQLLAGGYELVREMRAQIEACDRAFECASK